MGWMVEREKENIGTGVEMETWRETEKAYGGTKGRKGNM